MEFSLVATEFGCEHFLSLVYTVVLFIVHRPRLLRFPSRLWFFSIQRVHTPFDINRNTMLTLARDCDSLFRAFLPFPIAPFLFLFLAATPPTLAQFLEPFPLADCSQGIGLGVFTCANQEGCCTGSSICCAGGCCPITSWCLNQGTADEGCCPLSDTNNCGASVTSFVSFVSH